MENAAINWSGGTGLLQLGIDGLDLASATAMRNVRVAGRRTSVRLEQGFWQALDEIARREKIDVNTLCDFAAKQRYGLGLTAALRIYTLLYFRNAATEEGHMATRHGSLPRPQRL